MCEGKKRLNEAAAGTSPMVRAVKRKIQELGYEIAENTSLATMTPKEIELMNAEFKTVANNRLLAERAIKVRSTYEPAHVSCQSEGTESGSGRLECLLICMLVQFC